MQVDLSRTLLVTSVDTGSVVEVGAGEGYRKEAI